MSIEPLNGSYLHCQNDESLPKANTCLFQSIKVTCIVMLFHGECSLIIIISQFLVKCLCFIIKGLE